MPPLKLLLWLLGFKGNLICSLISFSFSSIIWFLVLFLHLCGKLFNLLLFCYTVESPSDLKFGLYICEWRSTLGGDEDVQIRQVPLSDIRKSRQHSKDKRQFISFWGPFYHSPPWVSVCPRRLKRRNNTAGAKGRVEVGLFFIVKKVGLEGDFQVIREV